MEEPRSVLRPALEPVVEFSDSDLFWQEHWKKFVWGLVALVALILAVGVWKFWSAQHVAAAEAFYATAGDPAAWREVVAKYPGTVAAGNAQLQLAESLRATGDVAGASGELENFLKAQPQHPLAGTAWLTLGELRQMQGENNRALEAYRVASSQYAASYAAPLALLAEAKLLGQMGSQGEARAVLESVGTLHSDTPAAMIAAAELARLRPPAAVPSSPPSAP
jgi:tetratricopeptide (TPR) repeat protein